MCVCVGELWWKAVPLMATTQNPGKRTHSPLLPKSPNSLFTVHPRKEERGCGWSLLLCGTCWPYQG